MIILSFWNYLNYISHVKGMISEKANSYLYIILK